MTTVFLLQNQDKLFLDKHGDWVDGRDAGSLFRSPHRDEAVNQMVEVNARDYSLRIALLECPLSERGWPQIDAADLPPQMRCRSADVAAGDLGSVDDILAAEERARPELVSA